LLDSAALPGQAKEQPKSGQGIAQKRKGVGTEVPSFTPREGKVQKPTLNIQHRTQNIEQLKTGSPVAEPMGRVLGDLRCAPRRKL